MPKEYKFIQLQPPEARGVHFKEDSGAGSMEGYCAVYSTLDEGGDIILPGASKDALDDFLSSGWAAHSHDWGIDGVVGYLTKAQEDETGLWVESKFHSTPDAQAVRTKAQERFEAGKTVGLSIGYSLAEDPRYILPKDYEKELPAYVKADGLTEALTKAKKFSKIRLLSKINNFEYSIVTAPMNKLARAMSVKSEDIKSDDRESIDDGSHAGQSFVEESETVLAAAQGLTTRAKEINELRTKEGRVLSKPNRTRLSNLLESLKTVAGDIETLLAETEPVQKADPVFVEQLVANFHQFQFKRLESAVRRQ